MKILDKKKILFLIIDVILATILIYLDRISKNLAVEKLKDNDAVEIFPNIFELRYLENKGAAFGILQNQKIFFIIIAVIVLSFIVILLFKIPVNAKLCICRACLVLIFAGAVGNTWDRLANNYVVDFFYFVLINFPIFNVADIYVTLSFIVLAIMVIFVLKDEDLSLIFGKTKSLENTEDNN